MVQKTVESNDRRAYKCLLNMLHTNYMFTICTRIPNSMYILHIINVFCNIAINNNDRLKFTND